MATVRKEKVTSLPQYLELVESAQTVASQSIWYRGCGSAARSLLPSLYLSSAHPQSRDIDRQLVEFDNFNRSTNDLASHQGRSRILQDRFSAYLKNVG